MLGSAIGALLRVTAAAAMALMVSGCWEDARDTADSAALAFITAMNTGDSEAAIEGFAPADREGYTLRQIVRESQQAAAAVTARGGVTRTELADRFVKEDGADGAPVHYNMQILQVTGDGFERTGFVDVVLTGDGWYVASWHPWWEAP